MSDGSDVVDRVVREEWGTILATLIRACRDFDLAGRVLNRE